MFAHWTYYESPIGWVCISGNGGSIADTRLMEAAPTTFYTPVPDYLLRAVEQLDEYFHQRRKKFDLSLDMRQGTDFQRAIWGMLLEIPYGTTTTYQKLADRWGDKNAVRAVGGAVGQNPMGIIIPCHRVIGSDGSLTGFAWGIERKRFLLQMENPNAFGRQEALF